VDGTVAGILKISNTVKKTLEYCSHTSTNFMPPMHNGGLTFGIPLIIFRAVFLKSANRRRAPANVAAKVPFQFDD